ncbi:signal peptidase II [Castellaniella sp.]|uniref:signal peptidase II n=1 Tax=Castellaniella sp. TaxID=1955812 RepID=UPI003564F5AB
MPEERVEDVLAFDRRLQVFRWMMLSVLVLVIDLITKSWIIRHLHYDDRIPVLPFFDLTLRYNEGIAFGFLVGVGSENRWLLPAVAIVAIAVIAFWIYRDAGNKFHCTALALILGGAAGNAWERIDMGYVTDFFLFYWNAWYFPAFNVADAAITVGAAMLIYEEVQHSWRARARKPR